jgi:hypothetical protein
VKLIHLLVVVAFLGISASVARADGVDPIVFTKGCGGTTGTICDAVLLTPGSTTVTVTEFFNPANCGTDGSCTATDSVINETGAAITSFTMVFQDSLVTPTGTEALTYSCQSESFFACSPVAGTTNAFTFSGNSICSTDDYVSIEGSITFIPDDNADDTCTSGVTIGLNATAAENLSGVTLTRNFFSTAAPEPSSALLLMAGLMAGLVSLKSLRNNLS